MHLWITNWITQFRNTMKGCSIFWWRPVRTANGPIWGVSIKMKSPIKGMTDEYGSVLWKPMWIWTLRIIGGQTKQTGTKRGPSRKRTRQSPSPSPWPRKRTQTQPNPSNRQSRSPRPRIDFSQPGPSNCLSPQICLPEKIILKDLVSKKIENVKMGQYVHI